MIERTGSYRGQDHRQDRITERTGSQRGLTCNSSLCNVLIELTIAQSIGTHLRRTRGPPLFEIIRSLAYLGLFKFDGLLASSFAL
jgi:hypothetical protein